MSKGTIFSIEEFSVFDGSGIRTTVFLKGCPLRCSWCHNPEGQSRKKEILRNLSECLHCGKCTQIALQLTGKPELIEACVDVCPKNLIRVCGTEYEAKDLCTKLKKNKIFYGTDGGVTFSGGEPLLQAQFLSECLTLLKGDIHTAVQTSGYTDQAVFREILAKADLFLFDLKVMDEQNAKRYTGVGSAAILKNFDTLAASGKSLLVRIPLIPEVVATEKNLEDIIRILKYYGITYAEAMPYNKLAGAKYALCGRTYTPNFNPDTPVTPPTELFAKHGITLKIL